MSKTSSPVYLGVEIGGTKLQLGLGAGDGRLSALERAAVEPSNGAPGVLEQVASLFERLVAKQGISGSGIAACGIGFGGPVDSTRGVVVKSHQVEGWEDFPLADWIRENLGIPLVSVHNDADAAGLAEALHGAGVGLSPLVYVTIGSGIGGGLIIDGAIYRGAGAGALEIGHLLVRDPHKGVDGWSELELVASGWSIARRALERRRSHAEDRGSATEAQSPETTDEKERSQGRPCSVNWGSRGDRDPARGDQRGW